MVALAAVFGLLLGVGINALADSLPVLRRPGRASCSRCGGPRPIVAWSGLAAFLAGRRQCPFCGQEMGWRPPAVELIMAAAAVLVYQSLPAAARFWPAMLMLGIFTLIVVIDVEHRLIMHLVSLPAGLLLGAIGILDPSRGLTRTLLGGVAGFGILLGLYLLGGLFARAMAWLRGRKLEEVALGFGDVTLSTVIGLTLGWPGIVIALLLGVFAAGLFSSAYLLLMMTRRRYVAFTPIPYGPFLILGALLVYFGFAPRLLGFRGP